MKLASVFLAQVLSIATAGAATVAATDYEHTPTFVYLFEGNRTNGIDGAITVQYDAPDSTRATITAALNFANVDKDAIVASDGNCIGVDITTYKWHIHVKWSSPYASEKLAQCGKALTGNHYDPLRACGPFSEFIDTPECQAKVAKTPYACSPTAYGEDPLVCEKGDLAGKVGDLVPDENGLVHATWVDEHYPSVGENTPEWNLILHAVCGKATPRVACALGQAVVRLPSDWKWGYHEGEGMGDGDQYGNGDEYGKDTPAPSWIYQGKPYGGAGPTPCTTTAMPTPKDDDAYQGNGQVGGY